MVLVWNNFGAEWLLNDYHRAVFKCMTVESYYVIVIATLSDWLKRLVPVFQPMRIKTKTNHTMYV